jgi:hypothetical protein
LCYRFDSEEAAASDDNQSENNEEKEQTTRHVIPLHFTASIFRSNLALPDKVGSGNYIIIEICCNHILCIQSLLNIYDHFWSKK